MTEVGPVTYQCPARPGVLHVLENAYFPEVIDPHTCEPVPAGIRGELVLTTLDRIGSPLLRYRTGDLVKPRARGLCACGRIDLALEGGIIGRADDMVVIRGVNIFPSLVEEIVRGFPEITEYRVTVDERCPMPELLLEVEPEGSGGATPELEKRLQESFQTALNLRIPVRTLPPATLPRFEMKARRWVKAAD
jgi:phenylacetate-CoA ligase